jgi:polyphosphate kinase 2 (PPK2 family)
MLETLDLSLTLGKKGYEEAISRLETYLPALQRVVHEHGLSVLVAFDGWYASGRGDSIAQLVHCFDPRSYRVHPTHPASDEDRLRPWMWRFWRRLPPDGTFAIFDRSWYDLLWRLRDEGELSAKEWERRLGEINEFERQLVEDGTVLIKVWLHISQKEQRRRLRDWVRDETQRWRVSDEDWKRHKHYRARHRIAEEMLARTHTHCGPWMLVEAEDENHRRVKVLEGVAETLRRELPRLGVPPADLEPLPVEAENGAPSAFESSEDTLPEQMMLPEDSPLSRVDRTLALPRDEYKKRLGAAQKRLRALEFECYQKRLPVVLVFEGWDAAGKGGAIRRLTARLDPRGYTVIPVSAPTAGEKARHYLWRFWAEIPKDGHWAIFDRSWYGRVLVERVEGFAASEEWRRAYQEINEFERAVTGHGAVLAKFWMDIGPDEQLRRFRSRERSPLKRHKINAEDWRNRAKWPDYYAAVTDMLRQTSTADAPWTIVEADDKPWARVKVLETVVGAVEERE